MIRKVKSMSGFYRLLKEVNELRNPIFRGHSSVNYELKSSSFRRLENKYNDISKVRKNLSLYHEQLIGEFKENKYHQSQIGELTDLEILAKLQHYGAATCFLDFSKNIAVALWFACSSKKDIDGRVYILKNTQDVLSYKRINSTQLKYNIDEFYKDYLLDEDKETKENELTKYFLLWEPPYLSERILQQDSIFLFSKKEDELDSESFLYRVDIDKSLKKEILKILNKLFNINKKNIYKDFHGFASSHAQNEEIDFIDDGIKYFEIANQYYQANEDEKALEFYRKAIDDVDDKNILIEIYESMAILLRDKYTSFSLNEALEYQIKAIEIREKVLDKNHPNLATSYNNLSTIYKNLGGDENLEKAFEYQIKAIEIREKVLDKNHPNLATSYNNLSIVYKNLGGDENLEKALEYQTKAIKISEKVLDKNHPNLATSYNNLSTIYKNLGGYENLEKALIYIDKAVDISKISFPDGHINLEIFEKNRKIIIDEMNK